MNAKDACIEFYSESPWLTLAKKIVRDEVQRLMEHRTIIHTKEVPMKVFSESKFLKHQELEGQDWVVTIDRVERQELKNRDNNEIEKKFILFFKELEKGMILNATNMGILNGLFKSDESDDWVGKRVTLYTKDDIEMGGKIMSGLRIRAKLPAAV